MLNLIKILEKIYSMLDGFDKIPSNFDFINNEYAIEVKVADTIFDYQERQEIPLQIRLVGVDRNKIIMIEEAERIDKIFNNEVFFNNWIVRNNPYISTYSDNDKFNIVLSYYVKNYK